MAPRMVLPFADRRSRQASLRPSTSGAGRLPPFGSLGASPSPGSARGARLGSSVRGDASRVDPGASREAPCVSGMVASVGLGWMFHDSFPPGRDGDRRRLPEAASAPSGEVVGGEAQGAGAGAGAGADADASRGARGGGRAGSPAIAPSVGDALGGGSSGASGTRDVVERVDGGGAGAVLGAGAGAERGAGTGGAGPVGPADARAPAPYPSLFPPSADGLDEPARLRLARLPLPMASEASLFDGMVRLVALGALADLPGLARRAVCGVLRGAAGGAEDVRPASAEGGPDGARSDAPETASAVSSPALLALTPLVRLPFAAGRAVAAAAAPVGDVPSALRRRVRRRLQLLRGAARGGLVRALDRAPRGGGALGRAVRRSLERLAADGGREGEGLDESGSSVAARARGRASSSSSSDALALSQLRARLLSRARRFESVLDVRAALQCAEEAATLFPRDPDALLAAAKQWTDLTFHPDVADDDERRLVNQRSIALADRALAIVRGDDQGQGEATSGNGSSSQGDEQGTEAKVEPLSAPSAVLPASSPPRNPEPSSSHSSPAPSPRSSSSTALATRPSSPPASSHPPAPLTPSAPSRSSSSVPFPCEPPRYPLSCQSRPLLIGCVARGRLALFARSTRDKVRLATEAREAAAAALQADPEADFALHAVARWEYELAKLPAVLRRAARLLGVPRVPPGSLDAALRGYEAAERRSPLRILHPVERARVLSELGRKREALVALHRALTECPVADINDWHARADGLRLRAQLGGDRCPEPQLVVGRPLEGWGGAGAPPALPWPGEPKNEA